MLQRTRLTFLAAALVTCTPVLSSHAIAAQTNGCSTGGRLVRTGASAAIGAFVGLVAVKIVNSDWTDASRTPAGIRAQNRGMAAGALFGAAMGNLPFLSHGCATSRGVASPGVDRRSIISADEIRKFGPNGTAYELVYSLRKQWLNTRGAELSESPLVDFTTGAVLREGTPMLIVYLDNARLGDQQQLRTIPLAGVLAVRYYDPAQATLKWGQGHRHGAIQVITMSDEAVRTPAP